MREHGIRRIRGTLIHNPTDLGIAFPYGGTELGVVRDGRFRLNQVPITETAEEWGGQAVDVIQGETQPVFIAIMAEWSNTGPVLLLEGTSVGVTTRRAIQSHSQAGSTRSGLPYTVGGTLLVAPDSPQDQALLLYSAVPHADEGADPSWSDAREWGIPMVWVARLDIQKRTFQLGPIAEMTL